MSGIFPPASELGFPGRRQCRRADSNRLSRHLPKRSRFPTSMGERCISASLEMWLLTYGEGKPR